MLRRYILLDAKRHIASNVVGNKTGLNIIVSRTEVISLKVKARKVFYKRKKILMPEK